VSQNPPDQPELPRLPDAPADDVDPTPADPQPPVPDPEPFEPVPAPVEPETPVEPEAPLGPSAAEPPAGDTGVGDEQASGGEPTPPPPPPPPAPPEYSDAEPAAEGSDGSGKSPLVPILGGLAALLLIGGGLWYFLKDDDGGGSPEQTVRDYFDATQDGDCERLVELVNEQLWSENGKVKRDEAIDQCEESVGRASDMDVKLKKVKTVSEKDGKATVKVDVSIDGDDGTVNIDLRKIDGDWKINEL
jgi:hypothetical protein